MVEVYTIPQQRNPKQPVRLNVQVLCVVIVMSLVLEEELLGNNISGKGNSRYAEAGEGALKTVEAGEGTGVSPLLTSWGMSIRCSTYIRWAFKTYYRAQGSPFVPLAAAAANFLGSKPVMEGRGAIVKMLLQSGIAGF